MCQRFLLILCRLLTELFDDVIQQTRSTSNNDYSNFCLLYATVCAVTWKRRVWKGRAARKARGIDKILSKNCWERRLTSGRPSLPLFSLSFRSLLPPSLFLSLSSLLRSSLYSIQVPEARACFSLPSFSPSLPSPLFHLLTMNRASSSLSLSVFLSFSLIRNTHVPFFSFAAYLIVPALFSHFLLFPRWVCPWFSIFAPCFLAFRPFALCFSSRVCPSRLSAYLSVSSSFFFYRFVGVVFCFARNRRTADFCTSVGNWNMQTRT